MKTCISCNLEKDESEFKKDLNQCRKCKNTYFRNWRKTHPEYQKKWDTYNYERRENQRLKRTLGITLEQKKKMILDQNGLCAACLEPLGTDTSNICVDHDHKTNKIRKILHQGCNISLARMNEDPNIIMKLAEYAKYCNSLK